MNEPSREELLDRAEARSLDVPRDASDLELLTLVVDAQLAESLDDAACRAQDTTPPTEGPT